MLSIQKILVPVVFTDTSRYVVRQAAWLARRFHAEIILLHVVAPLSYPAGMLESGHELTAQDLHAHIIQQAEKNLDAPQAELEGIAVTRLVLRGDPAREIVNAARDQNAGLIVMSTFGSGEFYRYLVGSVTAKVLHETPCPVWTGAHLEDQPAREFAIRNVLCSVDLSDHSRHTVTLAAEAAAAFDATLTLVHITSSVESWGPGGAYVDPKWKQTIIGIATQQIAELQQKTGTKAEVIIDSGSVAEHLKRAIGKTKADVLVIGHTLGRGHLGDNGNGYGIITGSSIPVLSV